MSSRDIIISSHEQLLMAIQNESRRFQEYYVWLEKSMPAQFFEEVSQENMMLITHSLMGFYLQECFSTIHLKRAAIVLCLDSPDADLRVLKQYSMYGIKNYQAFISLSPPPEPNIKTNLRIVIIYFTEAIETIETPFPQEDKERLRLLLKERNPQLTDEEFNQLIVGINTRFLRALKMERLVLAFEMLFRAKTRDNCHYQVNYNENWAESNSHSMEITLAWRNTPKFNFLYRLARTIFNHGLVMKRVNATYIDPYSKQNILVMALNLHGSNGKAVWDVADIVDFIRELMTVKYFSTFDPIDTRLVAPGIVTGNQGNLLRAMISFAHQALVHVNPHIYTTANIEDGFCRHPELTVQICTAFKLKFDPDNVDYEKYLEVRNQFLSDLSKLDTGHEEGDTQRKNILQQGMNLVHYTLKTNCYRLNYTALSFRLDPKYLEEIPIERARKFPELPYAIFFIKGMHFFGFHIRFKDLARGGLRTVYPKHAEHAQAERDNIFTECYNLAYTQHKKNKDIPEGGAKAIIFLRPTEQLDSESLILKHELESSKVPARDIEKKLEKFRAEQKIEYLHQAQRSFIESLLSLVNCEPDGKIRAKNIVDYWHKPEYLYLGPDENMHDEMIQWIADFSAKYHYKPDTALISSKPGIGIGHKEYGVTSLGVTVYLEAILNYIGLDPTRDTFTIKMSGGPDGDVAGNQINNFYKYYPDTAKLLTLIDASGTIYDAAGLDLKILVELFKQGKPIKNYPPEKLSEGGFLVDQYAKRNTTAYTQQTLCWRKKDGKVIEDWITGSDMNFLLRQTVHRTPTDVFIPAGGRPRTLNEANFHDFLDPSGKPTSRVIIEGANLYITPRGRVELEHLGSIVIKDSSANKTGVICSSFEVLCGLTLGDQVFLENKEILVREILERLKLAAMNEAHLLIATHQETGELFTAISDKISERINLFTYQLLDDLEKIPLSDDANDPLIKVFLSYCLPTLRTKFTHELIREIPESHKKAIIACHISSQLVYKKGLNWIPSLIDMLPIILSDKDIVVV